MKPERFVIPLLVVGVIGSAGGWHLQERAADSIGAARQLQNAEIPEEDSPPPSPEDNRAIIDNLQRGTAIRQEIDTVLRGVRASVERLGQSQDAALAIATRTRRLLRRVAGSLGASAEASRTSIARLRSLEGGLRTSDRLGILIMKELAELDRKMGPSAGEP